MGGIERGYSILQFRIISLKKLLFNRQNRNIAYSNMEYRNDKATNNESPRHSCAAKDHR
jgi:hypothetical protein